jgi:hypothetical protein
MRFSVFRLSLLLLALLLSPGPSFSQRMIVGGPGEQVPIDAAAREALVDSLSAALSRIYVFPDVAQEMEKQIRKNLKEGRYDAISTVQEYTMRLTEDLRAISHDKHLGLHYSPPELVVDDEAFVEWDEEARERRRKELQRENFMFRKLEVLPGNVGYLRLDAFPDAYFSGPTAVAAMNFLAYCDALIIDLRMNGGGSPTLIQLMMSYLFEEPTHLNSFYIRKEDFTKQFWSLPYAPGPGMAHTDLYVLVGPRTGSAAEEFAYNVQSLKRGTLVGESTWGGAHPVELVVWKDLKVGAHIPFGRAVNPVTGTNWEGAGVQPDIEVPATDALDRAHLEALRKIEEREEDPQMLARVDWAIAGLDAKLVPKKLDTSRFSSYAGTYEDRVLTYENGDLFYQRGDRPKMKAIPMTETLFRFEEADFFRLEIVLDGAGDPVLVRGHYDLGMTDESRRTGK